MAKPKSQNFEALPQSPTPPSIQAPASSPHSSRKRLLLLILPAFVFVLLTLTLFLKFRRPPPPPPPPPASTPTPTLSPEEVFTSPWATHPAVLQIDANLNQLETHLTQTDLQLQDLLPPTPLLNLEFDVK